MQMPKKPQRNPNPMQLMIPVHKKRGHHLTELFHRGPQIFIIFRFIGYTPAKTMVYTSSNPSIAFRKAGPGA
jgi:hypothetical protein